jgi:hypothetical protein
MPNQPRDVDTDGCIRLALAGVLSLLTAFCFIACSYQMCTADRDVNRHLHRAASASSLADMADRLGGATAAMEARGMTSGHTNPLWKTDQNDIGKDYHDLHQAQARARELQALPRADVAYSNTIIDLREMLQHIDVGAAEYVFWRSPFMYGVVLFGLAAAAAFVWIGASDPGYRRHRGRP